MTLVTPPDELDIQGPVYRGQLTSDDLPDLVIDQVAAGFLLLPGE